MTMLLLVSVFAVAALYASVGHGGASGYLAVLALLPLGMAPAHMATTALVLNVLVAGLSLAAFACARHFSWRLTWPFLAASVPAAALGGMAVVKAGAYLFLLGGCLLVAAARLWWRSADAQPLAQPPPLLIALGLGAAIGWLSGLVGIGGGIFLSPLLLLCGWAAPQQAAASAAAFIFVNSLAGLAGRYVSGTALIGPGWPLLAAALAGGIVGARLGASRYSGATLRRMLALVLVLAAVKLAVRGLGA